MARDPKITKVSKQDVLPAYHRDKVFTYDHWVDSLGIPVYRGYYIPDLGTLELGWWEERECNTAFIQLAGQEGVTDARVTEIPPGKSLSPFKFALDEFVYVVEGRGLAAVWADGSPKKTFEWQKHSLFLIPFNCTRQFSNMQGNKPARLLHYTYFPLALSVIQDPTFFINNPHRGSDTLYGQESEFYSEAKAIQGSGGGWGSG